MARLCTALTGNSSSWPCSPLTALREVRLYSQLDGNRIRMTRRRQAARDSRDLLVGPPSSEQAALVNAIAEVVLHVLRQ